MANKEKIKKVEELSTKLKDSDAVILAEYRGLSVPEISELREKILDNSTFEVTKNTLLKIAAKNTGLSDDFIEKLEGPTAIAFVNGDVYATIKEFDKFGKDNENLKTKYAYIDGEYIDSEKIAELAKLESKEVLYAKIAMLLKMSVSNVVGLSKAFGTKLDAAFNAYHDKLEANPGAQEKTTEIKDENSAENIDSVPADSSDQEKSEENNNTPENKDENSAQEADGDPNGQSDS